MDSSAARSFGWKVLVIVFIGIIETSGRIVPPKSDCLDVAVVGAGVGGTYTAWKLRNSGLKIGIFENTDRIGGRIYSMFLPTAPGVPVEMGAMRFEPDVHTRLVQLVDTLGLEYKLFEPFSFKKSYYLRGQRMSFDDLLTDKLPFNLGPGESHDPDVLSWNLLQRAMNTSHPDKVDDFEEAMTIAGKPLYKHGFLDLMDTLWTSEAKQYLQTISPYYSHFENNNAVDSIPRVAPEELAAKPPTRTLVGGMNTLPRRLAAHFLAASDNHQIHLNKRVDYIRRRGGKRSSYKLNVFNTETVEGQTSDTPEKSTSICAKHVILACPKSAHQQIKWKPFQKSPEMQNVFNSVTDNSAMKIFLVYPSAWWDNTPVNAKSFVSDIALRQTLEMQRFTNSTGHENVLMLVSYLDGETAIDTWTELRKYEGSVSSPSVPAANKVSNKIVEHLHHHLATLYDVTPEDIPQPLDGTMVIWRGGDYGGAWEYLKPGYKSSSVEEAIRRPSATDNVFVVTNSYSAELTYWTEGTLRAADEVIKSYLSHL